MIRNCDGFKDARINHLDDDILRCMGRRADVVNQPFLYCLLNPFDNAAGLRSPRISPGVVDAPDLIKIKPADVKPLHRFINLSTGIIGARGVTLPFEIPWRTLRREHDLLAVAVFQGLADFDFTVAVAA